MSAASATGGIPIEVGVVDVVVFRRVLKGWQVLALQRADAPNVRCPGAWEMVHGKVEPGESLPAAARRECFEETGLTPTTLLSIGMHPFYVVSTGKVQLAGVFAAVVESDQPVKIGEEHQKHAWLTISAAARRYVWPHERRVLTDAYALLRTPEVHDVLRVP